MGEWQDISTAPKDGTWVLCYAPSNGIGLGAYSDWEEGIMFETGVGVPTHWMPLPPAPEAEK